MSGESNFFKKDSELITQNQHLKKKFIAQLNKDIVMSGLDGEIEEESGAEGLVNMLESLIDPWLRESGEQFANFCYRVDIGEKMMSEIFDRDHGKDTTRVLAEQILLREIKKVILREQLKSE